jgi:hypothetical protein
MLQKDVIGMMCMNLLDGQDDLVIISLEGLSSLLGIEEECAEWVDWRKIRLLKETKEGEMSDIASTMIERFGPHKVDVRGEIDADVRGAIDADDGGERYRIDGGGEVAEASTSGRC